MEIILPIELENKIEHLLEGTGDHIDLFIRQAVEERIQNIEYLREKIKEGMESGPTTLLNMETIKAEARCRDCARFVTL
ncbi:MAG: hypothetical protein C4527_28485 [Candidatus Omnitrophota bacterium]|jgi:predicted DNA-binding protein|nr:MAG: hypothetical protein C4527_28485 [Candidatus Omnitrophota bacterium]